MDEKNNKYDEMDKKEDESIDISDQSDKDLLKDSQKGFEKGIETEEYDILPKIDTDPIEEELLSSKKGVNIEYSFNGAEAHEGLKIHYRSTIYKRNAIYSILLLIIFMIYVINIVQHPNDPVLIFLAAICLAVLMFLWYIPAKHIKKIAQAADSTEMKFKMTVYDDCIHIAEDNGGCILKYNKEITKIFETPNIYLISIGKERMYILPKRCLAEAQEQKTKGFFKKGMKDNYIDILEKKQ